MLLGAFNLLFGVLTLIWPGITLTILIWLFAITMLVQGFYLLISTIKHSLELNDSWMFYLLASINLGAGIVALFYPDITVYLLIILMGLTWLATGISQIIAALQLRKEIRNEGWLALTGLVSMLSGLSVLINSGAGALALLWLIAIYAILFGVGLLILGFKAKKWIIFDDLAMWAE
jgi:uncharacterized membrane protein HdeD (DUF308 family)